MPNNSVKRAGAASSSQDWFRHDVNPSSPVAIASFSSSSKLGGEPSPISPEDAAELREQFHRRQQDKAEEKKRNIEESKLISEQDRELLRQQAAKETAIREQKRAQLRANLDEQLAERAAEKAKGKADAERFFQQQQEEAQKWTTQQTELNAKKKAETARRQQEHRDFLEASEQRKRAAAGKRREEEQIHAESFTALLDKQEAARNCRPSGVIGQSVISATDPVNTIIPSTVFQSTAAAAMAATAATYPGYSAPESFSRIQASNAEQRSALQAQIEERHHKSQLRKQEESEYAANIAKEAAAYKQEEDAKLRAVRQQNLQYRAYLEEQIAAKAAVKSKQSAAAAAPAEAINAPASSTRPW